MRKAVSLKVINLAEFKAKMDRPKDVVNNSLRLACEAGAFLAIIFIKLGVDDSGLHRRSGNLIGSITIDEFRQTVGGAWITFGPHTVYAAIHEFGGIILPTNGPYLVFEVDGHLVFTKSVQIPARPYLRPSMDKHELEIVEEAKRVLVRELDSIHGA